MSDNRIKADSVFCGKDQICKLINAECCFIRSTAGCTSCSVPKWSKCAIKKAREVSHV